MITIDKEFKKILSISNKFKKYYILLFIIIAISISIELGFSWFLMAITNTAVYETQRKVFEILMYGLALLILGSMISFFDHYLKSYISNITRMYLTKKLINKFNKLPIKSLSDTHSGDLLSRSNNDIKALSGTIGNNLITLIRNPLTAIASFVFLLNLNWKLALICLFVGPLTLFIGKIFGGKIRKKSLELREDESKFMADIQEAIIGHKEIKIFSLQEYMINKLVELRQRIFQVENQLGKLNALLQSASTFVGTFAFILTIGVGSIFVANNDLSVGGLIAFVQLLNKLTWPFTGLAATWGSIQSGLASVERIYKIYDEPIEIQEGNIENFRIDEIGKITFSSVSFSYTDSSVLNEITFQIEPKQKVAIVGPSGSGKSTIFNLIMGFYDNYTGNIFVNNNNIKEIGSFLLREQVTVVPQNAHLFTGTILDNIKIGNIHATENEVLKAAKAAGVKDFIQSFPHGFNTLVGERGSNLSGGQKQKICIARALLKNAPIILLDEYTSSLDAHSEDYIQDSINILFKEKTVLIIAHKISTVIAADNIIVVDNGKIVDSGTHQELITRDGTYKEFYNSQLSRSTLN